MRQKPDKDIIIVILVVVGILALVLRFAPHILVLALFIWTFQFVTRCIRLRWEYIETRQTDLPEREIKALVRQIHDALPATLTLPARLYAIPKELATSEGKPDHDPQRVLQALAADMARFLSLPVVPEVTIQDDPRGDALSQSGHSGRYTSFGPHSKTIQLFSNSRYRTRHCAAILAHEMTHCFFDVYDVRISSPRGEEILTDLAAAYLGFGFLQFNGYKPIVWTDQAWWELFLDNVFRRRGLAIGYLGHGTIGAAVIHACRLRCWNPVAVTWRFRNPLYQMEAGLRLMFSLPRYLAVALKERRSERECVEARSLAETASTLSEEIRVAVTHIRQRMEVLGSSPNAMDPRTGRELVRVAGELQTGSMIERVSNAERSVHADASSDKSRRRAARKRIRELRNIQTEVNRWFAAVCAASAQQSETDRTTRASSATSG